MFTHIAKAQTRELYQYDHDSKPYYFGITLGSNMSRFQTSAIKKEGRDLLLSYIEGLNKGFVITGNENSN